MFLSQTLSGGGPVEIMQHKVDVEKGDSFPITTSHPRMLDAPVSSTDPNGSKVLLCGG